MRDNFAAFEQARRQLEPGAHWVPRNDYFGTTAEVSIAISLKRIADALEGKAKP